MHYKKEIYQNIKYKTINGISVNEYKKKHSEHFSFDLYLIMPNEPGKRR